MELEVVDDSPVLPRVDEPVVPVALLVLLPLEVEEGAGGILGLDPVGPEPHHPPDDALVVALAHVILHRCKRTVRVLMVFSTLMWWRVCELLLLPRGALMTLWFMEAPRMELLRRGNKLRLTLRRLLLA